MEQHIISPKLLLFVLLSGILVLTTLVIFQYATFSPHIIACNEASGTTYIIKPSRTYEILIPTSSSKDTITCMGRSMVFYDRTVDMVFMKKENKVLISQLGERYDISNITSSHIDQEGIQLTFDNERIILQKKGLTYGLYSKPISDPFELVRTKNNIKFASMVGPELEFVVKNIITQNPNVELVSYIPMRMGEFKEIKLEKEMGQGQ